MNAKARAGNARRICLLMAVAAGSLGLAARAADLDPAQPYQAERKNPVTYDVDFPSSSRRPITRRF